jgi:hypothetical protein
MEFMNFVRGFADEMGVLRDPQDERDGRYTFGVRFANPQLAPWRDPPAIASHSRYAVPNLNTFDTARSVYPAYNGCVW